MKLWLNTLHPTRVGMLTVGPTDREQRLIGEHFAYWQVLVSKGSALLVGRTQDAGAQTVGLSIFEASDEASALALCQADPSVREGVMSSTVQPYRIALLAERESWSRHAPNQRETSVSERITTTGGITMPVANPPENMPRISPYLYYEDVASALTWLSRAFGLRERMRMPGPDGRIAHAEMEFADGVVMMGRPGPDYKNPKRLGGVTQSLYLYTDEVDKHFRRAKEAGARIISEPADQFYGDRHYAAEDPEGHVWYFAEHVRDVAPEDMKPNQA